MQPTREIRVGSTIPLGWQLTLARSHHDLHGSVEDIITELNNYYPIRDRLQKLGAQDHQVLWALAYHHSSVSTLAILPSLFSSNLSQDGRLLSQLTRYLWGLYLCGENSFYTVARIKKDMDNALSFLASCLLIAKEFLDSDYLR